MWQAQCGDHKKAGVFEEFHRKHVQYSLEAYNAMVKIKKKYFSIFIYLFNILFKY
jgi:hypothetical protein